MDLHKFEFRKDVLLLYNSHKEKDRRQKCVNLEGRGKEICLYAIVPLVWERFVCIKRGCCIIRKRNVQIYTRGDCNGRLTPLSSRKWTYRQVSSTLYHCIPNPRIRLATPRTAEGGLRSQVHPRATYYPALSVEFRNTLF
ncbi:hypothetical protein TNCV_1295471 [Trichonephila clavipes]|nr:hypothetical protein TNCV_1295471 [Trichonephila clavipes]